SSDILTVRDGLEFDEERLQFVDERLNLIRSLEKKYGATVTDVLEHQQKVDAELAQMGGSEQSAAALADEVELAKKEANTLAEQLHDIRSEAATSLAKQIQDRKSTRLNSVTFRSRMPSSA